MEKINVAELLKDCPSGMELDCTAFEGVTLSSVDMDRTYPIRIRLSCGDLEALTSEGGFTHSECAKCIIFPKGKTTWEGFIPPCKFKDGDIVYIKIKNDYHNEFIIVFKEIKNDHILRYVCFTHKYLYTDKNAVCNLIEVEEIRLAVEAEKEELFQAIKERGYIWNEETKTLESLARGV